MNDDFEFVVQEVMSWDGIGGIDRGCLSPISLDIIRKDGMFEYLVERREDPNYDVKRAVITVMGFLGDPRAISYLEDMMKNEEHNSVDDEAIEAMIRIGPESRDCIVRLINYRVPGLTHTIIDSLKDVSYEWVHNMLLDLLKSDDPDIRYNAARGLVISHNMPAPTISLIESILRADPDVRMRVYAIRILSTAGVYDPIVDALDDDSSIVRTCATNCIEDVPITENVVSLCRAANVETDEHTLENMIRTLGRIRSPESIGTLVNAMTHHNEDIRINAVRGLVNIGVIALSALTDAMRRSDPYIRDCAADAIVRIGGQEAADVLIACTQDEDPRVRRRAALSLRYIDDHRKTEALNAIKNDPEFRVRNAAKSVLGERLG